MSNTLTLEQQIAELRASNAALLQQAKELLAQQKANEPKPRKTRCQVAVSGGVSFYGMGKWPVTLYKEQWIKMLSQANEILEFIKENDALLKNKTDSTSTV